jgi:hypothetical protein
MIRSKKCFKCEQDLPHESFYKHSGMGDGLLGKCKECTKRDVRQHRLENLEKIRAYDRSRAHLPSRVDARRAYQKTDAYKISSEKSRLKWKVKNSKPHIESPVDGPKKRKANATANNAIRDKRLIPWPVCAIPECEKKPEGHHPDYDRPLDVVWLCKKHHLQAHKLFREIQREKISGTSKNV